MGIAIKKELKSDQDWLINASTLEEFVTKQIILNEKVSDFKKIYKSPDQHLCLFLIEKSGATFVFLPRSKS